MMLFPAVLMNSPNSEVCLIGEWSIEPAQEPLVLICSSLNLWSAYPDNKELKYFQPFWSGGANNTRSGKKPSPIRSLFSWVETGLYRVDDCSRLAASQCSSNIMKTLLDKVQTERVRTGLEVPNKHTLPSRRSNDLGLFWYIKKRKKKRSEVRNFQKVLWDLWSNSSICLPHMLNSMTWTSSI